MRTLLHGLMCAVLLVLWGSCGVTGPAIEKERPAPAEKSPQKDDQKGAAYGLTPIGPDDADPSVFTALELADQGRLDEAISALRAHLKKVPNALFARMQLGAILQFDGKTEACISVWREGLSGFDTDYMIWLAIGEIRLQQGKDGPFVSYRQGTVTYHPKSDDVDEEAYKKEHLELAAAAFEKALDVRPNSIDAVTYLASAKGILGDFDGATELFEQLAKLQPDNGEVFLALAKTLIAAGKQKEGIEAAEKALKTDPRLAKAHLLLAEHYKSQGDQTQEKTCRERAEFYEWMAPFATAEHSAENWQYYQILSGQAAPGAKGIEGTAKELAKTDTQNARDFLSSIAWHHMHGTLDDMAFAKLTEWGAKEPLFLLLEHGQSTCTIKYASLALAELKAESLFEKLVEILPGDIRPVHSIEVARALDRLGDPRAVPHLIKVLNPSYTGDDAQKGGDPMMLGFGRKTARVRAALALGSFDTTESRASLEECLSHPELNVYCHAALYRLTKSDRHKKALEAAAAAADEVYAYMIEAYLKRIGTAEATTLAKKWLTD